MKLLFRGYNLEKLADDKICKFIPGMDLVDGIVCVANLDVEFEGSGFDDVVTLVSSESTMKSGKTKLVHVNDPSDEVLTAKLHKFADLLMANKSGGKDEDNSN